jgi:hypothetical protein
MFLLNRLTDEQLVERIRRGMRYSRKTAAVVAVLFGLCFVAMVIFVVHMWHAFPDLARTYLLFHHGFGIGLALGFVFGATLFAILWQVLYFSVLALGAGIFRMHALLLKYHDLLVNSEKT